MDSRPCRRHCPTSWQWQVVFGTTWALKSDGTVIAWGDNSHGQTNLPAGLSNVVAIAAGYYHSLAVCSDGTVQAWGDGLDGQT